MDTYSYSYSVDIAEPVVSISMEPHSFASTNLHDTATCFNCGAPGHNVSECPRPYDAARVRSARKDWTDKRGDDSRYYESYSTHITASDRFTPGSLSEKLKVALGMKENEAPPYYWRMQIAGYPPGYLLPIALHNSNSTDQQSLQIYNETGDYLGASVTENQDEPAETEPPLLVPSVFFPGLTITPRTRCERLCSFPMHTHIPEFCKHQECSEYRPLRRM